MVASGPVKPARRTLTTIPRRPWWWLDPLVGLGIAGPAVSEGIKAWRGQDCC
jgi:hypothetical protein